MTSKAQPILRPQTAESHKSFNHSGASVVSTSHAKQIDDIAIQTHKRLLSSVPHNIFNEFDDEKEEREFLLYSLVCI